MNRGPQGKEPSASPRQHKTDKITNKATTESIKEAEKLKNLLHERNAGLATENGDRATK